MPLMPPPLRGGPADLLEGLLRASFRAFMESSRSMRRARLPAPKVRAHTSRMRSTSPAGARLSEATQPSCRSEEAEG
jgi:hypothetical protein